jgi:hypothetical protein
LDIPLKLPEYILHASLESLSHSVSSGTVQKEKRKKKQDNRIPFVTMDFKKLVAIKV